jgi:hypothetical protein
MKVRARRWVIATFLLVPLSIPVGLAEAGDPVLSHDAERKSGDAKITILLNTLPLDFPNKDITEGSMGYLNLAAQLMIGHARPPITPDQVKIYWHAPAA